MFVSLGDRKKTLYIVWENRTYVRGGGGGGRDFIMQVLLPEGGLSVIDVECMGCFLASSFAAAQHFCPGRVGCRVDGNLAGWFWFCRMVDFGERRSIVNCTRFAVCIR